MKRISIHKSKAGRPPGSRNKRTLEVIRVARENGELPLDYMLRIMRMEKCPEEYELKEHNARRDAMAQAAAPYLHARLQRINHTGQIESRTTKISVSLNAREAMDAYAAMLKEPPVPVPQLPKPKEKVPRLRLVKREDGENQ